MDDNADFFVIIMFGIFPGTVETFEVLSAPRF